MSLDTKDKPDREIKRRKIIGLYSPAPQSGKTTLANFLVENFNFERRSFSTPLKHMVNNLLLFSGIDATTVIQLGSEAKEAPIPLMGNKSYRELCQSLGMDWGRLSVDDGLWVKIALGSDGDDTRPLVIDDVRFANEYRAILRRGGEIWRISREEATVPNDHPSEGLLEQLSFDRHLTNNGSKQELFSQLIIKET